jgi:hypothetical protein
MTSIFEVLCRWSIRRCLGYGAIDFHGASSSTAEQRTLNPQVSGSNPEGRTTPPHQVRAHF